MDWEFCRPAISLQAKMSASLLSLSFNVFNCGIDGRDLPIDFVQLVFGSANAATNGTLPTTDQVLSIAHFRMKGVSFAELLAQIIVDGLELLNFSTIEFLFTDFR